MKKLSLVIGLTMTMISLGGCKGSDEKPATSSNSVGAVTETTSKEEDKGSTSEGNKEVQEVKTFDRETQGEALEAAWVKLLGANTLADNKIGNIMYNLSGDMADEKFDAVQAWISEDLGAKYDNLKKEEVEAKETIAALGVTEEQMGSYYTTFDSLRAMQDKWVESLRTLEKGKIEDVTMEVDAGTLEYSLTSQRLGAEMVEVLQMLGYSDEEIPTTVMHIIRESLAEYGDPEDLKALESFE